MEKYRKAGVLWTGDLRTGHGIVSTESRALFEHPFNSQMRFEDEPGTNPEELIAAAHSGCFAMKLSFLLGDAGFTPDDLSVEAKVTFEDGMVTESHLDLKAKVPGITDEVFQKVAAEAKATCPISKSLKATISLTAALV